MSESDIEVALRVTVAHMDPPKRTPSTLVVNSMQDFRAFLKKRFDMTVWFTSPWTGAGVFRGIAVRESVHVRPKCWIMFDKNDNALAEGGFSD